MFGLIHRYSGGFEIAEGISNYSLVAIKLTGAGYLEALQFVSGLARSSNKAEIEELSEAQLAASNTELSVARKSCL